MLWAVQVALVERWTNDEALIALISGRVFDGLAPQGTPFPYVRIGSKTEVPNSTLDRQGWVNTVTADAFSTYQGDKELLALVRAMNAAVKDPLLLDGYGMAYLKPEFTATLVEEDGKVRHAPVRYRIFSLENL